MKLRNLVTGSKNTTYMANFICTSATYPPTIRALVLGPRIFRTWHARSQTERDLQISISIDLYLYLYLISLIYTCLSRLNQTKTKLTGMKSYNTVTV